MKRLAALIVILLVLSSCKDFLEENPAGVLSPSDFYTTAEQVKAAVNGTYEGLNSPFVTDLGVATSPVFDLEYLTGYCLRPRPSGYGDNQFLQLTGIDAANEALETWWTSTYYPVENCNSVLAALAEAKTAALIDGSTKSRYIGEVSFLRAYYYFQAVRLWGRIPLKTTPTTSQSDGLTVGKSSVEAVYDQIVKDLEVAEQSALPWTDKSGRVSIGAVKALLSKVYLTMAGYPLQKGSEYYIKAYGKAKEVIQSNQFSVFDAYADLRDPANDNSGEHLFMLQREGEYAPGIMHFYLMPYPEQPISIQPAYGGALASAREFYDSYSNSDQRKQEGAFFYTRHVQYGNPANMINLSYPYIYKYWDDNAESTGRNGANVPLIRFADVLLICAEAKANVDGGLTSDQVAVDAYYAVHHRAYPDEAKPVSITSDDVLKERFWELCFEFQTWYDMIRTRKALDVSTGRIVDLIGYKAPNHEREFRETDLLWPVPLTEVQKDPALS